MKHLLALTALLALTLGLSARAGLPDIYPDASRADTDLAAALQTAAATHRRIIIDFGGNWCPDCHVLDTYLHDEANRALVEAHFLVVHVNIGQMDRNLDLAQRYGVPLRRGVPALAVLDTDGRLLYSQTGGEFENMRGLKSAAVTQFLEHWSVGTH